MLLLVYQDTWLTTFMPRSLHTEKKALKTQEVADLILYLLSSRSSGINGQGITIDAGMGFNYFDKDIVEAVMEVKQ